MMHSEILHASASGDVQGFIRTNCRAEVRAADAEVDEKLLHDHLRRTYEGLKKRRATEQEAEDGSQFAGLVWLEKGALRYQIRNVRAWMVTVGWNYIVRSRRQRQSEGARGAKVTRERGDVGGDPVAELMKQEMKQEQRERLKKELANLPPNHREALLRTMEGVTTKKIAKEYKVTPATILRWVMCAISRLRLRLKQVE